MYTKYEATWVLWVPTALITRAHTINDTKPSHVLLCVPTYLIFFVSVDIKLSICVTIFVLILLPPRLN